MQRKHLMTAIVAGLGLAGAIAYAANRGAIAPVFAAAASRTAVSQPNSAVAGGFTAAQGGVYARVAAKPLPPPAPPTAADVGDVDSFGRNVRWLGNKNAFTASSADCAGWSEGDPDLLAVCQPIVNVNVDTPFAFNDIARFNLPANASNSLLCHWLNPRFQAYFTPNSGSNAVMGTVNYSVDATVENPVLNDPGLIDPTTNAPFNGRLNTGSLTFEVLQTPLLPGLPMTRTERSSVTCNSGVISKQSLMQSYGLSQAQADDFFRNPTTVRMNIKGRTRFVDYVLFSVGMRLVGD